MNKVYVVELKGKPISAHVTEILAENYADGYGLVTTDEDIAVVAYVPLQ